MTFWYRVYGLVLRSEIFCPELPEAPKDVSHDFSVRAVTTIEPMAASRDLYLTEIAGVARYSIREGREIGIQMAPGARNEDVRQYFYGVALTALLYQRGESPIHAAAIAAEGGAHIFCGASGSGKSTLMIQLQSRGLDVLCDDVGVVRQGPDDMVRFYPGVPRLKLWQDALSHFSIDHRALQRDLTRHDKFHLHLRRADGDALPLASIFCLVANQDVDEAQIVPLSGRQTFEALIGNTYRPRLLKRLGDPGTHAVRCAAAARQATGFEFRRPWDLQRLSSCADTFYAYLAKQTSTGGKE